MKRPETSIPLSFTLLARKIEDILTQQHDRIAFHHNDEANDYRVQERRLSALMLDKTLSNEEHLRHARAIVKLADTYEQGFVRRLLDLNNEIERELLGFKQLLNSLPPQTIESENDVSRLQRWIRLSEELHQARAIATTSGVANNVALDKWIPNIVIQNDGRVDMTLSPSDQEQLKKQTADVAFVNDALAKENRIQAERELLTRELFPAKENERPQSTAVPQPPLKTPHPLEGKAWFRLVKVVYAVCWVLCLGVALLFGLVERDACVVLL